MVRPRIFVSSTYYDLKHVRSSLNNFIESLGFDSVLSEKGDIAYSPDAPLDESCYREATTADILVIVIGGRYGSAASTHKETLSPTFFERYDSITKKEYESAADRDIPTYILIEANVHAEYRTFLRNKNNKDINYAHVDSVNIFHFIEEILGKPRNNPIQTFERFADIEGWLREQWAGLFRELLNRMSSQQQIATLSTQVETLSAINKTLRRYLEVVVKKVSPDDAGQLIENEHRRLSQIKLNERLKRSIFYLVFSIRFPDTLSIDQFRQALEQAKDFDDFAVKVAEISGKDVMRQIIMDYERSNAINRLNECRELLGKPPFKQGS